MSVASTASSATSRRGQHGSHVAPDDTGLWEISGPRSQS